MTRKSLPWILLVVACLGAGVYSWQVFPQAFPLVNVELTMNRSAALDSARVRAERLGLGPEAFSQAAAFRTDSETKRFVELEGGGTDALRRMIETGRYQPYRWVVRHYQAREPREVTLRFTPDGQPYGFEETWPEDAEGPALSADSARTIAERAATTHWGVDLDAYERLSASQQERPNGRVDHTFVYQRPDVQIGEGRYRLRLRVSGASLSEVTRFVHVPEAFSRRFEEMRSANNAINLGGLAATMLIYVLGGCLFGAYWLLRRGALKWRMAAAWGGLIAGLQVLAGLNQLPLAWMNYDTALSAQGFLVQQVLTSVAGAAGMGLLVTLSFMAAEGLTRLAFGHHPRLWRLWAPEAAGTSTVLGRTVGGYLLVALFLAYQVALYSFAQDALGWWTPADLLFDPNILAQYAPWLPPIANALQAGFWEECLFRAVPLAGAALIGERLGGRRWWIGGALLLQAVIFGAGHAGYATQPAYARLVELILPALGFGALYLAYGLLPAVVLHFTFDVVWMSLPLFVSAAPGVWLSRTLVVVLTLVPLFAVLYGRLRTGAWTPLPERFYNRTWTPDEAETAEGPSLPVSPPLPRRTAGALVAAGLVGVGAWVGTTAFSTVETPLTMTRAEAETQARTALREHGADPEAWTMASSVVTPRSDDDRFVWQESERTAYAQLMGSYLDGPFWRVRFYTFEGPVAERAEEYRVHLAPGADRSEVVHRRPEAAPGDSLAEPAARARADSAVRARYGLDPATLSRVGAEPTARPNRRDWTFTYADTAGYPLSRGEPRIQVEMAGAEVTDVSSFVHVPESWERASRRRDTGMQIVGLLSGLLAVLLLLGGAAAAVVAWARGHIRLWTALSVGGGLLLLILGGFANDWPATVAGFDTAQPYLNQVLFALVGPLVLGAAVSGGLGLIAGVAHDRIGGAEPTPYGRLLAAGLGLGGLGAGLLSLAGQVGPSLTPPWAPYGPLDAALPWLAPIEGRLLTFAGLTVVLLLVAVALHRWTRAATRRTLAGAGAALLLGFVGAGLGPAETLGAWALQGAALGSLLAGAWLLVWRYDRALVPMMAAGFVGLRAVRAAVLAPIPSIAVGEGAAALLVLAVALGWTALLRRRQRAAAASTPTDEIPASDSRPAGTP
ncbi:MAG: CPBP family intramembrane glutamic endopeptidase [Salinibacter sp.]